MNKKNKNLFIFRVVGVCLLAVGILLDILGCTAFRKDIGHGLSQQNTTMVIIGFVVMTISYFFLIVGFMPLFYKISLKLRKTIQEENKDTLKDIANTNAEILQKPIVDTVKAVRESSREDKKTTKFCKHCGSEIDSDSIFCKNCGKQQ